MKRHRVLAIGVAAAALLAFVPSPNVSAKSGRTFLSSVHVNADQTATFPLRHGVTTDGRDLWFVIIDASNSNAAAQFGVNVSDKLRNAWNEAESSTAHNNRLTLNANTNFRIFEVAAGAKESVSL